MVIMFTATSDPDAYFINEMTMMITNKTVSIPRFNELAIKKILLGGFFAGLADFLYPTISTVVAGGSWMRPWQGVAGGLFGRAALGGGMQMAITGIALHFFICFVAAALLYLMVSRIKWLPKQWVLLGVLYGIAFLAVMNYVILPLSAIGRSIYPLNKIYVAVFFHILLVGWPTAYFISGALKSTEPVN